MTNMRMDTIMDDLKDMFENDFGDYPENINCDNEFNNKEFIDYFTSKRILTLVFHNLTNLIKNSLSSVSGAH